MGDITVNLPADPVEALGTDTLSEITVSANKEYERLIREIAVREINAYLAQNEADIKSAVKTQVQEMIRARIAADLAGSQAGAIHQVVTDLLNQKAV